MKAPKVVSLFSGCGGSSLGYKMAGCRVIAAVEFVDFQAENYRRNYPGVRVYEQDIRTLEPKTVLSDLGLRPGELDILDGSPPCAAFTLSGDREKTWGKIVNYSNRKQRTDDLFFEYVRFVRGVRPKMFVAENVKGLTIGVARGMLNEFLAAFEKCGYDVQAKVLDAANYSVPQHRKRVLIVGTRKDLGLRFEYPEPHARRVTVADAIGKMKNSAKDLAEIGKRRGMVHGVMLGRKPGENAADVIGEGFSYRRLDWLRPSSTIVSNDANQLYHPKEDRNLTIREAKMICGFPESFVLTGDYRERFEALARAVPPPLMAAMAGRAIECLRGGRR